MLLEEEIIELNKTLEQYPQKRAASIEALKIIQHHRGWVSDESIADLSEVLEMTPDELDNVATFYNLIFRKPVGRHVIMICDSVSCYVMKYEGILDYLNKELGIHYGETTGDNRFTLLPIPCLGACDKGPAMMIDQDLHTNLSVEIMAGILAKYK